MRLFILLAAAVASWAQAPPADPLVRARQAYNDQRYEDAIAAATEARRTPALADAARVIIARAHLERSRLMTEPGDLAAAREVLREIDPARLSPRDHVEFLVGLGESLFLENSYSAAAVFFELALARVGIVEPEMREQILEWWAGTLDYQAQFGPESERRPLYRRILDRVEQELERTDASPVALYWLAAAARGVDDIERAWGAAQASWIRAAYLPKGGVELRADLDRLVTQVILPERARRLSPDSDRKLALENFQAEWDALKLKWK